MRLWTVGEAFAKFKLLFASPERPWVAMNREHSAPCVNPPNKDSRSS